jgi:uncharacterized membrane protein
MAVVGTAAMAINIALAILIARMTQQIVHGQVAQLLDGLRYQETLANAFGITSVINKYVVLLPQKSRLSQSYPQLFGGFLFR